MMAKVQFMAAFLVAIFSTKTFAYTELSFDFNYNKQTSGQTRQNTLASRIYSGSIAKYLFNYTALELNYSFSEEITTQNETIPVSGTNVNVISYQNKVENIVYGIGLRQAFAGRGSIVKPAVSFGYAKQFIEDRTNYTFEDSGTGASTILYGTPAKSRSDSVFAAFILQIAFSQYFAIRGSIKTVFPAFETEKAKDDLKYSAGLTWIF